MLPLSARRPSVTPELAAPHGPLSARNVVGERKESLRGANAGAWQAADEGPPAEFFDQRPQYSTTKGACFCGCCVFKERSLCSAHEDMGILAWWCLSKQYECVCSYCSVLGLC